MQEKQPFPALIARHCPPGRRSQAEGLPLCCCPPSRSRQNHEKEYHPDPEVAANDPDADLALTHLANYFAAEWEGNPWKNGSESPVVEGRRGTTAMGGARSLRVRNACSDCSRPKRCQSRDGEGWQSVKGEIIKDVFSGVFGDRESGPLTI
jgi:hypothetical protein